MITPNNIDEAILIKQEVDLNSEIPILNQVLRIAVYDEFKAYETYTKIIEKFGYVNPFVNIKEAEARHYSMLIILLEKYGVEIPINDWADKITIPNTLIECCELGVAGEIKNIQMYDNLIANTNELDVKDVLYRLQAASFNNHLPAFRNCVANHYSSNNLSLNEQNFMDKIQEYQGIFEDISSGNIDESKISQILSKLNVSMISGAVLGAASSAFLANYLNKNQEE